MVSREQHEPQETYWERVKRADEAARLCREEQNRLTARFNSKADRDRADQVAREQLARLRRKPCEIDPDGRLPNPGRK